MGMSEVDVSGCAGTLRAPSEVAVSHRNWKELQGITGMLVEV